MKIFISWSGANSERVANALVHWLPLIFQNIQPWISTENIHAGSRWALDLADTLEEAQFGILCVTPENMLAPWLVFEAGALSRSVARGRVVPYLVGMQPVELAGPLTQFQAVVADMPGTRKLVQAVEESQPGNKRPDRVLDKLFETFWPELKAELERGGAGGPRESPRGETASSGEARPQTGSGKTTEAAFLESCPEWARPFFVELLREARLKGLTVSWGTKGFSVRARRGLGEQVSVLYGYPPGSMAGKSPFLEIYLKHLGADEGPDLLRVALRRLPAFREQGQYTIGLPLTRESLPEATEALQHIWSTYDRIRSSGARDSGSP